MANQTKAKERNKGRNYEDINSDVYIKALAEQRTHTKTVTDVTFSFDLRQTS